MTAPRRSPNWTVPTAPRGTSDSRAASTAFITGGGAGPRIVLPSPAYPGNIFYVSQLGNDSTGNGTLAAPWLTPTGAYNNIVNAFDFGGQTVTLQAVAGHAAFTTTLTVTPWVGGGSFIWDMGGGSIAAAAGDCISIKGGALPGRFIPQNGTLSSVNGSAISLLSASVLKFGTSLTFGACAGPHVDCEGFGLVLPQANYAISGGAYAHLFVVNGTIDNGPVAPIVTISNAPNFGVFAQAIDGFCKLSSATYVNGNTVTGKRFDASANGVVATNGAGPNYFPGNVAGTTGSGGQYV